MTLFDLEEIHPQLAKGLRILLEFDGDVKATFETTFQISFENSFGEKLTVDLKENGGEVVVDESNRQEYVDLYVDYLLTSSVAVQVHYNHPFV